MLHAARKVNTGHRSGKCGDGQSCSAVFGRWFSVRGEGIQPSCSSRWSTSHCVIDWLIGYHLTPACIIVAYICLVSKAAGPAVAVLKLMLICPRNPINSLFT